MRKVAIILLGLVLIGLSSGLGLADTTHPLNVYLSNDFLWLEVSGNASTVLTTNELTGSQEKNLTSTVSLWILSLRRSCTVFASAPDFSSDFPITHLQLRVNPGNSTGTFRTLSNNPVIVGNYPSGHTFLHSVDFKLINLPRINASAGTYQTVVTYTAVTPAIGE